VKRGTDKYQTGREALAYGPITYSRVEDPATRRQPPSPHDAALNRSAAAWLAELPERVVPLVLAHQFPRIVNRLSRFWDSPRMLDAYFEELLIDTRGRRKGFPMRVLDELRTLAAHHRSLHKSESTDLWDSIPYRKSPRG
jgi:hypothetical protein